ncbi:hypothetical protein NP233_g490 [Leucocoprinus birnbaumii]|uniref:Ricin B lectin domain-containing protein n=1 Tax=Leucocoprinus birnbaumii TaxID=56174 RepID=A0AAD5W2R1_9AGAR|nr:hypothetical protein NP233_g490 [Leucocoprinus birnbaumii]
MSAQIVSGQTYKITNVKSGNVVDLSGLDNHTIIGYPYHSGKNQQWKFEWVGDAWTIQSVSSGQYIGTEGSNFANGTQLVSVTSPFKWDIWHDEANQNAFRFYIHDTRFNWDSSDYGDTTPGRHIILWTNWSGVHQTWTVDAP